MKRIKVHIRQHWTKYFCLCGPSRDSKEVVAAHQWSMERTNAHGGLAGTIHEADEVNYVALCKEHSLPHRELRACRPCIGPDGRFASFQRKPPQPRSRTTPPAQTKGACQARCYRNPDDQEEREILSTSSESDVEEDGVSPPTKPPLQPTSQAHCILSGEPPVDIFDDLEGNGNDWMRGTITLGPDSEAKLEAILDNRGDISNSSEMSVPSALIGLPPLELVVPAEVDLPTVTHHLPGSTLPQLVVEVQNQNNESTTRRVKSVSSDQSRARHWLTDSQPPLLNDISHLADNDQHHFIQLEEEMRRAAVRNRRHVYRAAMESDRMREFRATVQDSFLGLLDY